MSTICNRKTNLLKEELRYASNVMDLEEKFSNLQKSFQEKLTAKISALKAARKSIQELNENDKDKKKDKVKSSIGWGKH